MTVEEFLKSKSIDSNNYAIHDITNNYLPQIPIGEWLREFAAYHVEKALDAAYSNAKLNWNGIPSSATYTIEPYNTFYDSVTIAVDSNSIYHSYPLDNIR